MPSPAETYQVTPKDLTIILALRCEDNQQGRIRRAIHNAQMSTLETMATLGAKILRVDYGSTPALGTAPPWITPVAVEGVDSWNEPKAKNIALRLVQTPYTAITNTDVFFTAGVLDRTFNALRLNGDPKHFVLQGVRWELPRLLVEEILRKDAAGKDFSDALEAAERLGVPAAIPRLPTAEWQVFRTEDALAVGGLDERMDGYGASDSDIHERLRLYIIAKYGETGCEIMCRTIPVLHAFHYAKRPLSPNRDIRIANMTRFIKSGELGDLTWNSQRPD